MAEEGQLGPTGGKRDGIDDLLRGDIDHGHGAAVGAWLAHAAAAVDGPVVEAAVGRGDKFGIDIEVPKGTPADGEVSGAAMGAGYGRAVILNHGHEVMRAYEHHTAIAVLAAQYLTSGTGERDAGQTGRATDPDLHLEVQIENVGEFEPVSALRLCAGDKLAGNQSGC